MTLDEATLAGIKWNERGLVPAIVQDARTRDVLMMAYMNADSLNRTLALGQAVFWSRRRGQLWRKGETSGNTLSVLEIRIDCDADTILLLVAPAGPTCHTGATSCFFRDLETFAEAPKRY